MKVLGSKSTVTVFCSTFLLRGFIVKHLKYIKISIALVLALFLTACRLGGEVTGLESGDAVSLMEDVSGNTVIVDKNGKFEFSERFLYDTDYHVSVLEQPGNNGECRVANGQGTFSGDVLDVKVECEYLNACTKEYAPVCAKQAASIQCITTPCPDHIYKTFGNACMADKGKARIAFNGECGNLEGVVSDDSNPVRVADLKVMKFGRVATLLDAKLDGDNVEVEVGFSGCDDEATVDFYVSSDFMESNPVQVGSVFPLNTNGDQGDIICMAYWTKKIRFDLLPLKYKYIEMYGTESGEVIIQGVGLYKF